MDIQEKRSVVSECSGCSRIEDDRYCTVYAWPEVHWGNRRCPMATHKTKDIAEKNFRDPLKESKSKFKRKK